MLQSILNSYFFRDLFTKEQKWFIVVWYLLIGIVLVIGYAFIAVLKLFSLFLGALNAITKR